MNQDFLQFEGSWPERIRRWLTPGGTATLDGARLAMINGTILLVLFVLAGVFSILRALTGWLLPVPTLLFGFTMILISGFAFAVIWYRFSAAYRQAAVLRGNSIRSGTFGLIAASPFLMLTLMLLGSGLMALFFGLISFSTGQVSSAILRMFYAMLFLALAAGNVVVARYVSGR